MPNRGRWGNGAPNMTLNTSQGNRSYQMFLQL